jgi:catechol 2,3-dioxygenase-like lactoylglutathione lyase family enzyme
MPNENSSPNPPSACGRSLDEIHHLAINVVDLEQAVKWYTSSFSCVLESSEESFAVLRFANLRLVLVLPSQQQPHLGFEREDAQAFGELRFRLDGMLSSFLSDPSGNPIEIIKK